MSHLSRIRLEPAPAAHEPRVDSTYEFVAPLDGKGHIDTEAWKAQRLLCFVHRSESGEIVQRGLLVHRSGGAGGGTWAFDYEQGQGDEEPGFRFESHRFAAGEYVSIRDADGALHTYRVHTVQPA